MVDQDTNEDLDQEPLEENLNPEEDQPVSEEAETEPTAEEPARQSSREPRRTSPTKEKKHQTRQQEKPADRSTQPNKLATAGKRPASTPKVGGAGGWKGKAANLGKQGLRGAGQLARGAAGRMGGSSQNNSSDQQNQPAESPLQKTQRLAGQTANKVKEAAETAKRIIETPQKIREAAEAAKRAVQIAQRTVQVAQRTVQVAQRTVQVAQKAIEVSIRMAQAAAQAAQAVYQAAVQAAQVAIHAITEAVVFLVSNPVGWVILIIILIFVIIIGIFTCGRNGNMSEAGGSVKTELVAPASEVTRDSEGNMMAVNNEFIHSLQEKVTNGSLVIYSSGIGDLNQWNCGTSGPCTHTLDYRLLRTISYLSDLHDYLKIGLIKTNSPRQSRYKLVKSLAAYSSDGEESTEELGAFTAFSEGQALAIVAVDRSQIPEMSGQPIEISWQRTLAEAEVRPLWEELGYVAGWLDTTMADYRVFLTDKNHDQIVAALQNAPLNKLFFVQYFQFINRVKNLLDRAAAITKLDDRTQDYLSQANNVFSNLQNEIGLDPSTLSNSQITALVEALGTPEALNNLRLGIGQAYKATQVANMVGWNKSIAAGGNLEMLKAYEARNKIRLVIKELLDMPTKIALRGESRLFDKDMVVKQIITYSPEDDLDNGLDRLDIFPSGITSVGVGGVGFDDTMRDGIHNDYDDHFSRAPLDNGVFSKMGVNFIYNIADLGVTTPAEFIFTADNGGEIYQTPIAGELLELWDALVGEIGVIDPEKELAKKATYQDFIQVGF
ncbi:MAG: hypothetical protein WC805_02340 [Patescibacteria group bacterium]|jgi:hypothetical protein